MKERRGFTLIELLVVIAIIAILAAILFPVFARARATARKTSCMSNIKNINMGMVQYVQDFDERFPYWNWGNRANIPSSTFWSSAIMPYVKNVMVYQCPDDVLEWNTPEDWTRDVVDGGAGDPFVAAPGRAFWERGNPRFNSYGMNETLNYGAKLAQVLYPSQESVIAESSIALYSPWHDPALIGRVVARAAFAAQREGCCMMWEGWLTPAELIAKYGGPKCEDSARHMGGIEVSYVDSHVKFQRWQDLTPEKLSPW